MAPDPLTQSGSNRRAFERQRSGVPTLVRMRLGQGAAARGSVIELVKVLEGLALAGSRWRQDLEPAGRQFVDRLTELADMVVGTLAAVELTSTPSILEEWGADWVQLDTSHVDLSLGGMGIEIAGPPPPTMPVEIEFQLVPETAVAPFHLGGRVVHVGAVDAGRSWFGVQWDVLPARTSERLARTLAGTTAPPRREDP